ncbi:MAG: hypothetical protein FD180_1970 [Planctomycetota bacterium]|nr:MAG: hypothetical protein FD180_1970 [Planctomycetota bacterium]
MSDARHLIRLALFCGAVCLLTGCGTTSARTGFLPAAQLPEKVVANIRQAVTDEILAVGYDSHFLHTNGHQLRITPVSPSRAILTYELWPFGEIFRSVSWDEETAYLEDGEYLRNCLSPLRMIPGNRSSVGYVEWLAFEHYLSLRQTAHTTTFDIDRAERIDAITRENERTEKCRVVYGVLGK